MNAAADSTSACLFMKSEVIVMAEQVGRFEKVSFAQYLQA